MVSLQGSALPQVVSLCSADHRLVWLSVLFVYKGALLLVGIFLAWETRQVHLKHLNDSKLIGASIYGIVVLSVVLAVAGVLLESAVNASYGVIGALLLLGNTTIVFVIFGPMVTMVLHAISKLLVLLCLYRYTDYGRVIQRHKGVMRVVETD